MEPLGIAIGAGLAYLIAYYTYGRWLGGRLFQLSAKAVCPSEELADGVDYVPAPKAVVFGHHFTSIAGTGPIVGPAIAIMWGWLPALLWVVFGSIFIGAVHDFGSLVVSLRYQGQTVGDIAGRLINRRVRLLFLLTLFLLLTVVLAVFGLVIASVFSQFPAAIFPCFLQIPIAVAIGLWLRKKGGSLLWPSLAALGLMYLSVFFGDAGLLARLNQWLAGLPLFTWALLLLGYAFAASVLPVWLLLQPRDYINSLQLTTALGLIVAGLAAAAFSGGTVSPDGARAPLEFVAPVFNPRPEGAPWLAPFLFITVACGAISGFHCLVSSGTSSKQLMRETDARFVGYGGMLLEGFLATLVIVACGAGIGLGFAGPEGQWLTGKEAWLARYSSWTAAGALQAKVAAFVDGAGNFLRALGMPSAAAKALMGVLVASFAGTTMDTACRLHRYVIQELGAVVGDGAKAPGAWNLAGWLRNRYGATLTAVAAAALLAAIPPPGRPWSLAEAGKGGLLLWPLFGAVNQLLAGLAFLVVLFYLWRRSRPVSVILAPMLFMLAMPFWAMAQQVFFGNGQEPGWIEQDKWLLALIGIAAMILEVWMVIEGVRLLPRVKGALEPQAPERREEAGHPSESDSVCMGC